MYAKTVGAGSESWMCELLSSSLSHSDADTFSRVAAASLRVTPMQFVNTDRPWILRTTANDYAIIAAVSRESEKLTRCRKINWTIAIEVSGRIS